MKVAVVILNWNGKILLEKFLPSVVACNASFSTIYVADNASTDNSVEFLKTNYPQIKIIQNTINGGFAKGYNDALNKIDAEYFVLLNSDVEVTPNWIEPIIQLMDNDKQIAACQPKLKSYSDKDYFEYAGAAGGFIDKYGYPFCRGRIFNTFEKDESQYDDVKEIMWATGACLFIRADIFKQVGGLDEDFFAHMEEIDLCWRIKNLGWKVMYCPSSTVYHLGGGTLSKINHQKTYLNFRNNLYLLCKNHSSQYFRVKMIMRLTLDGIAGIKFLLSGEFDHFTAVLKAHVSFYQNFFAVIRKRNAIKKQVVTYTTSAIYRESLIKAYFFKGVRKFSELNQELFY